MSHPILPLSSLQSAMFLLNSRPDLLTAAPLRGHPFSRSYGANLPSSLTWFLSRTLVYSTFLPVSVYGTDNYIFITLRSFSWQCGSMQEVSIRRFPQPIGPRSYVERIFLLYNLRPSYDISNSRLHFPAASLHHLILLVQEY